MGLSPPSFNPITRFSTPQARVFPGKMFNVRETISAVIVGIETDNLHAIFLCQEAGLVAMFNADVEQAGAGAQTHLFGHVNSVRRSRQIPRALDSVDGRQDRCSGRILG
ncbi:MAG: hypothetical protein MZV63_07195 [Marinilabiliales bacterium]|nr:hypothetical protein [Marinilabiliales bacterium]